MSTTRQGLAALALGALLLVPFSAGPGVRAAESAPFAGTVKDTLGNVVAGVEILFIRQPSETYAPTAVTHTDATGRFEVGKLIPARYRYVALKQGYLTLVGQVNTGAQTTLDVVLRPTLSIDAESLPRDPSWALRLPRRGMLHDTGAPGPSDEPGPAATAGALDDVLRLELEQMFSIGADAVESNPDDTEIQPSETRMTLASTIGERGNFMVEGRRERLDATAQTDLRESTASREGAAVSMDLSYETSPDARLDVSAYYNQTDYELTGIAGLSSVQQEQQTWGYDAIWSKQLDATRRFAVALGFRDSSLVSPLHSDLPAPPGAPDATAAVANRSVDASGSYQRVLKQRHDLQVDLRTQLLRWPTAPVSSVRPVPGDRSTWTLLADAQDTWSLSSPFALIYGLGYKQALVASDATLVVPRLGGSLAAGGWFVRALVSYHSVTGGEGGPFEIVPAPFQPEDPLGYEAEVQVPLARDVHVRGGMSYSPIQFDYFGYIDRAPDPGEHPLYLTDGNSAVAEQRVTLVEERGSSRTYLELSNGRAEGTVAPLLPFDVGWPVVAGRDLRYRNGRLGFVFPDLRTDLRVEYRRVESSRADGGRRSTDSIQESVELRVKTDVPATQIPGDWRVLVALRMGTVQSSDLGELNTDERVDSVNALNRRISAGVSVLF